MAWYFGRTLHDRQGPVTLHTLQRLTDHGLLPPNCLVWDSADSKPRPPHQIAQLSIESMMRENRDNPYASSLIYQQSRKGTTINLQNDNLPTDTPLVRAARLLSFWTLLAGISVLIITGLAFSLVLVPYIGGSVGNTRITLPLQQFIFSLGFLASLITLMLMNFQFRLSAFCRLPTPDNLREALNAGKHIYFFQTCFPIAVVQLFLLFYV